MAKFIVWSFGLALTLAGLALGSAALDAQSEDHPAYLEPLAWLFFIGALVFLAIAIFVAVVWVGLWVWRYFHTVIVREGNWHSRYWPLQRIAQVYGVSVEIGNWAGEVNVSCQAQFPDCEQPYVAQINRWGGSQSIEFPQQPINLRSEPNEGDKVAITVRAKPAWWRGRASHRTVESRIGITDHRPNPPNTSELHPAEADQDTQEPAAEVQ